MTYNPSGVVPYNLDAQKIWRTSVLVLHLYLYPMEVKEKMDYEALNAIILSDNVVAQRKCFGTVFGKDKSVSTIAQKAKQMIAYCKVWTSNWETVQEAIAPELNEVRKKLLEEKLSRLSKEDKAYILEALRTTN